MGFLHIPAMLRGWVYLNLNPGLLWLFTVPQSHSELQHFSNISGSLGGMKGFFPNLFLHPPMRKSLGKAEASPPASCI